MHDYSSYVPRNNRLRFAYKIILCAAAIGTAVGISVGFVIGQLLVWGL